MNTANEQSRIDGLFPLFMRNLAHAIYGLDYTERQITSEEFLEHLRQCIDQSYERGELLVPDYTNVHLLVELLRQYLFEIDIHRLKQKPDDSDQS